MRRALFGNLVVAFLRFCRRVGCCAGVSHQEHRQKAHPEARRQRTVVGQKSFDAFLFFLRAPVPRCEILPPLLEMAELSGLRKLALISVISEEFGNITIIRREAS